MSLKDAAAPLKERGYGLAGISYDPVDVLGQFTQKREINFTLLSDQGSKSIDAWKLRDAQYPATSFAYGVPEPSIFVLAPNGKVKAKIALQGYKVRPSNADILAMVDGLKH